MSTSKRVFARAVNFDGSSYRGVVPKEIADRYGIEDGDNLFWEDGDDGSITVRTPSKE